MAVTIVKGTKAKAAQAQPAANQVEVLEPENLTIEELADQYGRLQEEIVRIQANPAFAHFGLIEEELKKRLEPYEPDEIVQVKGQNYMLEAGACSKEQRKVLDPMKVLDWLGADTFVQIAKVGVSDAEKYLNPEQCAQIMSVPGFTKNRKIKIKYLGGTKKST
jgi:hypothetical protein